MSPKHEYQSPALLEIGSLHQLTLGGGGTFSKVGSGSDVLTGTTSLTGVITVTVTSTS